LKKKYDIIFITSCCKLDEIYNLLESIIKYNKSLSLFIVIVNMSNKKINIDKDINFEIEILEINKIFNSSISRNIAIKFIINNNITSHFVCFPDDDTTYDFNFFNFLNKKINQEEDTCKNFATNVMCRHDVKIFYRNRIATEDMILTKYNFDQIGAVNLIINYDTFVKVKYFNEKYGVGSYYGAGEDGDYFLRCLSFSDIYFINNLYTIHPAVSDLYKNLNSKLFFIRMINYSRGVISVLCMHKMYLFAFYISIRALGGSIINIFKNPNLSFIYFKIFFYRILFLIKFSFNV